MDAFQLLRNDHQKALQVFKKLMSATEISNRDRLFAELKQELEVHAEIEEQIFYPALRSARETASLVKESLHEHDTVKQLLQKLDTTDHGSPQWTASLNMLKKNVEHHVHEEEEEMFPKAQEVLSMDTLEELGNRMQRKKKDLMRRV